MYRAKLIEHCHNCEENIHNIESKTETDVSDYSLMRDEPWDGTYYVRYKKCPKCGTLNAITIWYNNHEGYRLIADME